MNYETAARLWFAKHNDVDPDTVRLVDIDIGSSTPDTSGYADSCIVVDAWFMDGSRRIVEMGRWQFSELLSELVTIASEGTT